MISLEDPLEKEIATHSSILAWETPWTEEPGGYNPCGHKIIGHDLVTKQQHIYVYICVCILFVCVYIRIHKIYKRIYQWLFPTGGEYRYFKKNLGWIF